MSTTCRRRRTFYNDMSTERMAADDSLTGNKSIVVICFFWKRNVNKHCASKNTQICALLMIWLGKSVHGHLLERVRGGGYWSKYGIRPCILKLTSSWSSVDLFEEGLVDGLHWSVDGWKLEGFRWQTASLQFDVPQGCFDGDVEIFTSLGKVEGNLDL